MPSPHHAHHHAHHHGSHEEEPSPSAPSLLHAVVTLCPSAPALLHAVVTLCPSALALLHAVVTTLLSFAPLAGPDYLVAPVLQKGVASRPVYLAPPLPLNMDYNPTRWPSNRLGL